MTLTAAGYIIQDNDGYAIQGFGATQNEAWAQVVDGIGSFFDAAGDDISAEIARDTQFKTLPATAALIAQVKEEGGAIAWGVVDGIACTEEEEGQ